MAGIAAGGISAALSSLFANLTPVQLGKIGNHLTQSNEVNALLIVDRMQSTPALAPMLLATLSTIPNLPPNVMTWVEEALTDPPNAGQSYAQAKSALMQAAVAPGVLGNLGL